MGCHPLLDWQPQLVKLYESSDLTSSCALIQILKDYTQTDLGGGEAISATVAL